MFDFLKKTKEGVRKSREALGGKLTALFTRARIEEGLWDELEEVLITADVGVETAGKLLDRVKERIRKEGVTETAVVRGILRDEMARILAEPAAGHGATATAYLEGQLPASPWVVMVVGVNGSGKTTSIAKLANLYRAAGKKVILAAGDTFRAAAIDQLKLWGSRVGVDVIAHQQGADAAAVAYDSVQAAKNRNADVLIIDTAGRLQTKINLMEELKKVKKVLARGDGGAPHEVLLVLDATTGQNGLSQARHFTDAVGITGIFLAKLDGTARGGIVLAITDSLGIPLHYIGIGEKMDDVAPFNARDFVEALVEGNGNTPP
ncbi:MAG: signal recognition particle-docking protein FtsY [Chloroflexi bacterium]|nr:signal recognition particle-docking protein FtsY [Chloroflexota bacterium]